MWGRASDLQIGYARAGLKACPSDYTNESRV